MSDENTSEILVKTDTGAENADFALAQSSKMASETALASEMATKRHITFGWIVMIANVVMYIFFRLVTKESPPVLILFPLVYVILILWFIIANIKFRLGKGNRLRFFLIAFLVSYAAEAFGTNTGWLFGTYYYTEIMGPMLPGYVPALVPLVWFFMLFCALSTAELFLYGAKGRVGRELPRWHKWILLPGVTGLLMMLWDFVMDPRAVSYKAWVWPDGGLVFGIPLSNFRDWFLVSFVMTALYLLWEKKKEASRLSRHKFWYNVSVFGYLFAYINNSSGCYLQGLKTFAWIMFGVWLVLLGYSIYSMAKR